jgi:hypothetical protein
MDPADAPARPSAVVVEMGNVAVLVLVLVLVPAAVTAAVTAAVVVEVMTVEEAEVEVKTTRSFSSQASLTPRTTAGLKKLSASMARSLSAGSQPTERQVSL